MPRKVWIFLTGFGADTDRMRDTIDEYMRRSDTVYDVGENSIRGDFRVVGTTTFNNLVNVDRVIVPLCRLTIIPEDYMIWAYNPENPKAQLYFDDLVAYRFGYQWRDRRPLGFFDPQKGVAYCAAYAPTIKHEWTHLIHGFWHQGSYFG